MIFLDENQNLSSTDRRRPAYLYSPYFILQTIDRLASHLQNHLPREARMKIQNIAIEYVKCQVSVIVVHLWNLKTQLYFCGEAYRPQILTKMHLYDIYYMLFFYVSS